MHYLTGKLKFIYKMLLDPRFIRKEHFVEVSKNLNRYKEINFVELSK